jgi:hypothetical protein
VGEPGSEMLTAVALRVLLGLQLLFSCVMITWVTYLQHRHDSNPKQVVGAILWGVAYWLKSVLIVLAVVYGPERYHWVTSYSLFGLAVFAIGDTGLAFLFALPRPPEVIP